jgi:prolyl oligopeptidase
MKQPFHLIIMLLLLNGEITLNAQPPKAPSQPVTETYFGKQIIDPYRNLENLQDTAVQQWMKAQTDYTHAVLNSLPGRQQLLNMMKDFDKRVSAHISNLTITNNDVYFYLKTSPEDEKAKLYTRNGFAGNETLIYNPAEYSKDNMKKFVILQFKPADDGSLVTISIAPNGSENCEIIILDVNQKKLYPEKIDRALGGVSWIADNTSFLYNRYLIDDVHDKERKKNVKVYVHKLHTDPATDKEFFSAAKYPQLGMKPEETPFVVYDENSRYLFACPESVDNRLQIFYAPTSELNNSSVSWKELFRREDEVYDFTATDKDLYVYTPKNAPHFKILKTSLQHPDLEHATVVIPESEEETIRSFRLTSTGLYYTTKKNGVEAILYYLPKGANKAVRPDLPFVAGSISLSVKQEKHWISISGGYKYPEIWVTISGWTSDAKRYRYLPGKNEFKLEMLSAPAEYPELADLTVEEVTVPAHDGVKVPLSLVYKKGLKKDGNNRVALLGYGAYGISQGPSFNPLILSLTTKGVIVAFAHVRGGGELGEQWHKAGYKTTKPNTWKDVISCAEYLISQKYTSPEKLILSGGSAGGILVGRAITERPDLFAVAIPEVGLMNPLRFEESPNGPANVREFGTVKDSVECMALIEMDSYLHLKKGEKYPATLVTTGMNDPRVIVWQPAKFAARLQAENASNKPILFRVDYESGHGIGDVKSVAFERLADLISFALWQTGHPDFQLK